jgi:hypothetical protein
MLKFQCIKPFQDGGQTFKLHQEKIIDTKDEHYEYFNIMAQKGFFSVIEVKIAKENSTKENKSN